MTLPRDRPRAQLEEDVQPSYPQALAMAMVCLDLHHALGVAWGDEPYTRIHALLKAESDLKAQGEQITALAQEKAAMTTTRAICTTCGGNGVVKIPGGISVCPACDGDCWQRLYNLVANLAHPKGDHRENPLEDEAHDLIRDLQAQITALAQEKASYCGCRHYGDGTGSECAGHEEQRIALETAEAQVAALTVERERLKAELQEKNDALTRVDR